MACLNCHHRYKGISVRQLLGDIPEEGCGEDDLGIMFQPAKLD